MINYEQVFQLAKETDSTQTPGRLISLRLAFIDFLHHPFWGGGTKVSSLSDLYDGEVMLVSGFAMLLVYYGISMAIIWMYGFYSPVVLSGGRCQISTFYSFASDIFII